MIPVFLLLTALVVDVGNWYTHKRQLQNRADAAAFAAGVEYARNWKACIQTGDAALRASTGGKIADAARQYAGDPEGSDYSTGSLPTPVALACGPLLQVLRGVARYDECNLAVRRARPAQILSEKV